MNRALLPNDQVFWYLQRGPSKVLTAPIKTNIVVIGGGMAGLSAAQAFRQKGQEVVLLEKYYCGAGASGKSSGFITPSSEFGLAYVLELFGEQHARKLWEFVIGGVDLIQQNITKFNIACDYQKQDTLIVASSKRDFSEVKEEYEAERQLFGTGTLYQKNELDNVIGSTAYFGGFRVGGSFGINTYLYCQAVKTALEKEGVQIFEETPALRIDGQTVYTPSATVQADYIVVCMDRFLPDIGRLVRDVYAAQTFIMVSAPLLEHDIQQLFPGKPYMVWDTDMIYQYYRIINGNRFLIGGGGLISTFWGKELHNDAFMFKKLRNYVAKKFPTVSMHFEYMWPGLIGISKDIMPIADFDPKNNKIYYVTGATGLPWAAALGRYSAERILNGKTALDLYFSLERKFPLPNIFQMVFGKRITFALSNFISLYMPFLRRN